MKKKMIFAFVATMSFLAPNLADACSIRKECPKTVAGPVGGSEVSCVGTRKCAGTPTGVACIDHNGAVTVANC